MIKRGHDIDARAMEMDSCHVELAVVILMIMEGNAITRSSSKGLRKTRIEYHYSGYGQ
ncbi:hypothetical protein AN958_09372 [Leucoagaricus sp. SymC.cos]|nr:hypothetical protein AN958_09372 [Leucoagaricus sp. SymC.cos]